MVSLNNPMTYGVSMLFRQLQCVLTVFVHRTATCTEDASRSRPGIYCLSCIYNIYHIMYNITHMYHDIHICIYVYMYICICICVCIYVYVCIYIYIYIHIRLDDGSTRNSGACDQETTTHPGA